MRAIKLLVLLFAFNLSSIFAQTLTINTKTIQSLKKTGVNFSNSESFKLYLNSNNTELQKFSCQVNFEILKGLEEKFIDDELPEGDVGFEYINKNSKPIFECSSEGVFRINKRLFVFNIEDLCETIDSELVPGGDMFIPGGDTFIPGGDTFIPGGDTFSNEEGHYYFLKITFDGEQEILPAIFSLKVK
ncbi:hypothetical protein FBALC1_15642 [Flavobacteriales bacterium ALC-1]|nr:hypothetical protein FBALC1_15642 [Flavobacteriales bacterium ALC-1]